MMTEAIIDALIQLELSARASLVIAVTMLDRLTMRINITARQLDHIRRQIAAEVSNELRTSASFIAEPAQKKSIHRG